MINSRFEIKKKIFFNFLNFRFYYKSSVRDTFHHSSQNEHEVHHDG